jgi:hypothetical protein
MDLQRHSKLGNQTKDYLVACNVGGETQGTLRAYAENLKQVLDSCDSEAPLACPEGLVERNLCEWELTAH